MSANAQLEGFPPIWRLSFWQGSKAEPGKLIVETMVVGAANIASLPRITTLTINSRNFTGIWRDLKVCNFNRVSSGKMQTALVDSRWKLKKNFLNANYNERDTLGNVLSGQQKSISELATILKDATGLEISADTLNVPSYQPRAKWAGVSAYDAMDSLLRDTGCRLVYNPVDQTYKISLANTGPFPTDISKRRYRPGPPSKIKELVVKSAPVLYEDTLTMAGVRINTTTGSTELLPGPVNLPTSATEAYGQTRLRLWEPTAITHPEAHTLDEVLLLDHRAKAHLFDPEHQVHERARMLRDEWPPYPHHQPLYTPDENTTKLVELTGGGRAFLTDHPLMMTDATGLLNTAAKLTTAYYIKDGEDLKRDSVTVAIPGPGTDTLAVVVPWIRPVNSTMADMSGPVWSALHNEVANAIAHFHNIGNNPAENLELSNFVNLQNSGQVGAAHYFMSAGQFRPKLKFYIAFNFSPSPLVGIK